MIRSALLTLLALSLTAQTPDPKKPKTEPEKSVATQAAPVAKDATPTQDPQAKPAGEKQDVPKVEAPKVAPLKVAPPQPQVDKIVGVVGEEIIHQSDVDASLAGMSPQQQMQIQMMPNGKERFTQNYVESRLLTAKARKDGLHASEAFKKKLVLEEEQLLASEYLNKVGEGLRAKLDIKEDELKAFFTANPARFKATDKVSARHILIKTKPATDKEKAVTDEEAKAKAMKLLEEIKKGKKLEELVKDNSEDDGSKDKGGLYENFNPDQMVPEFANACRTQAIGVVGEPVKTQWGYHIIQVTERTAGAAPKFEEVKEQVRQAMLPERQEKVWKDFLGTLAKEIPMITGDAADNYAKLLKTRTPQAKPVTKVNVKKASTGVTK